MSNKLFNIVDGIKPFSGEWKEKAHEYLEQLAIPYWSLGKLLDIAEQISAIQETLNPDVTKKYVVVMAGDHGVVEEGVSAYPQDVTPQMVGNFVKKGASINVLSKTVGAEVIVVDAGIVADTKDLVERGEILSYKVAPGTKNMAKGPAMTKEEAIKSILGGIDIVEKLIVDKGAQLIATGDMGIGNTTPSSAIISVMTGKKVSDVTGRGTGVDDKGLMHKIEVIEKAIQINNPDRSDPLDVLAKVGGFEIGGIAGVILGAAYHKVPVVVDGFISSAGAVVAKALNPNSSDYMIASHRSVEPGHSIMWEYLGLDPVLDLKFRLGEGTGAAMAMHVVESASQVIKNVLTFEAAGVSENV